MVDSTPSSPDSRRRPRLESVAPLLAEPSTKARPLAEERAQLDADIAALRESEANLRAYEKRLRALQAEIDAARRPRRGTVAPITPKPAPAATVPAGRNEEAL